MSVEDKTGIIKIILPKHWEVCPALRHTWIGIGVATLWRVANDVWTCWTRRGPMVQFLGSRTLQLIWLLYGCNLYFKFEVRSEGRKESKYIIWLSIKNFYIRDVAFTTLKIGNHRIYSEVCMLSTSVKQWQSKGGNGYNNITSRSEIGHQQSLIQVPTLRA